MVLGVCYNLPMIENEQNFPKRREEETKSSETNDELFITNEGGEKSNESQEKMREEVLKMKVSWEKKPEFLKRKVSLAVELWKQKEKFPFPEITEESYKKIKADEDDCPGFATPIDEILERCKQEGIKIVLHPGWNTVSGNVYVLPYGSNDIVNDSLFPRHLQADSVTDERLKEIIELDGISSRSLPSGEGDKQKTIE